MPRCAGILRAGVLSFAAALSACGSAAQPPVAVADARVAGLLKTRAAPWIPAPSDTFQWQLNSPLKKQTANATIYDIDGFDNPASTIAALHAQGRRAVCYISFGTFETWRPDAWKYRAHPQIIGKADGGWKGEYWVDIRAITILGPILQARMDMCVSKGFDALEPDNIDEYTNKSGFPLTAQDQMTFNQWIAAQAHERGLAVALKNDPGQASSLEPQFDFALLEDCRYYGFCKRFAPFVSAGKLVIAVAYTDNTTLAAFRNADCPAARAAGYETILKHRDLDAWRTVCP